MDRAEIQERVIALTSEQFGREVNELAPHTSFVDELDADSLDAVELAMECEDEFEIAITDEEIEKLHSVMDVVDYIEMAIASGSKHPGSVQ